MAKALLGGMEIEIDEDGFIQEPDKWTNALGNLGLWRQARAKFDAALALAAPY